MTAFIADTVFDSGLTAVQAAVTTTFIDYTQQATTYTEASSTFKCGSNAGGMTGPAAGATSGRKLTNTAISAGTVSASQTAGWYAICSGTVFYFANSLSATQAVTSGNTFSLASFDVTLRGTT